MGVSEHQVSGLDRRGTLHSGEGSRLCQQHTQVPFEHPSGPWPWLCHTPAWVSVCRGRRECRTGHVRPGLRVRSRTLPFPWGKSRVGWCTWRRLGPWHLGLCCPGWAAGEGAWVSVCDLREALGLPRRDQAAVSAWWSPEGPRGFSQAPGKLVLSPPDERDRVQKKTFTKWVNKHLIKVGGACSCVSQGPRLQEPLREGGPHRLRLSPCCLCTHLSSLKPVIFCPFSSLRLLLSLSSSSSFWFFLVSPCSTGGQR